MTAIYHWTSRDLAAFGGEWYRYEIVNGELFISCPPHWRHQLTCTHLASAFLHWNDQTGAGIPLFAPGVIFADDQDVVPDLVWVGNERFAAIVGDDGKLYGAPELAMEVLSPGPANARRDREAKLKLYSQRGVDEYWIVDWQTRRVEVYRPDGGVLALATTLTDADTLTSPLLPGFACPVADLFAR
jgi:Uma2 family endonuclease